MSSYFSNPFRSSTWSTTDTPKQAPPVEDAPLDNLPEIEARPLSEFQQQTEYLFCQSDETLDPDDPWRVLSASHRPLVLIRFLRYHLLNISNATQHLLRVISWRKTKKPWTFPTSAMHGGPAGCPIIFVPGRGRRDEMILYVAAGMYNKSLVDHTVQENSMITMFEHCAYAADGRLATAGILILDMSDMMLKNVDLTAMRTGIKLFLDYYPEVFRRIILINYPRWAHSTYRLISPLLDTRTVNKICWLSGKNELMEELLLFFDHDAIPWWLGGTEASQPDNPFSGGVFDAKKCLNTLAKV